MTPSNDKDATSGDVASSSATGGAQPTPTTKKEIVMTDHTPHTRSDLDENTTDIDAWTSRQFFEHDAFMHDNSNPRPWLDDATAEHLTDTDLAHLDAQYARWSDDHARSLGIDLVEFLRHCAEDQARIRQIMGPHDVPVPEFATVHKFSKWELTDDGTDCVRQVDALYADRNDLNATLEVDQHAVSTRMDMRVHIDECSTEDPAELTRWALDLLALAGTWTEIKESHQ